MKHQPEKENAKDAVVFSTVSPPPATSVEIENPTLKPSEGFCNWCRNKPGDIFCDGWPICFNCIDIMVEQENALGIVDAAGIGSAWRSEYFNTPSEWEKY